MFKPRPVPPMLLYPRHLGYHWNGSTTTSCADSAPQNSCLQLTPESHEFCRLLRDRRAVIIMQVSECSSCWNYVSYGMELCQGGIVAKSGMQRAARYELGRSEWTNSGKWTKYSKKFFQLQRRSSTTICAACSHFKLHAEKSLVSLPTEGINESRRKLSRKHQNKSYVYLKPVTLCNFCLLGCIVAIIRAVQRLLHVQSGCHQHTLKSHEFCVQLRHKKSMNNELVHWI